FGGGAGRGAARGLLALVPGAAERRGDDACHALLVVDDDDAGLHAAIAESRAGGSRTVSRAPPPGRSPASMRPPCASTTWRATARPRPMPRGRGVKNGSKARARR